MGELISSGLLIVLILIYLILIGFLILNYVLQSLSLHTLARRRGIANPWLAWIPLVIHGLLVRLRVIMINKTASADVGIKLCSFYQ